MDEPNGATGANEQPASSESPAAPVPDAQPAVPDPETPTSAVPGTPAEPDADDDEVDTRTLAELRVEREKIAATLQQHYATRDGFLAKGSVVLLIFIVLDIIAWMAVLNVQRSHDSRHPLSHIPDSDKVFDIPIFCLILTTCLVAALIFLIRYFIVHRNSIITSRLKLIEVENRIDQVRRKSHDGRRDLIREQLARLAQLAARVLVENELRRGQAANFRDEANRLLDRDDKGDLGGAQFNVDSLGELIERERREQKEQRTWQCLAVGLVLFYIVGLVAVVVLLKTLALDNDSPRAQTPQQNAAPTTVPKNAPPPATASKNVPPPTLAPTNDSVQMRALPNEATRLEIPIFGIPVPVMLWAALGSLAAVLYRFYTEKDRVKLGSEVRWLFARPIIGIIMGTVVYFALRSGLFLLGSSALPATGTTQAAIHQNEVFWVIAFLAGFSDKFYMGIINLLVAKSGFTGEQRAESGTAGATSRLGSDEKPSMIEVVQD